MGLPLRRTLQPENDERAIFKIVEKFFFSFQLTIHHLNVSFTLIFLFLQGMPLHEPEVKMSRIASGIEICYEKGDREHLMLYETTAGYQS